MKMSDKKITELSTTETENWPKPPRGFGEWVKGPPQSNWSKDFWRGLYIKEGKWWIGSWWQIPSEAIAYCIKNEDTKQ